MTCIARPRHPLPTRVTIVAVMLAGLGGAACRHSREPTVPPPARSVAGRWSGPIPTDQGLLEMELTLAQVDTTLTGELWLVWTEPGATTPVDSADYAVAGAFRSPSVTFTCSRGGGAFQFAGTLDSRGQAIIGTIATVPGTITLVRRPLQS